MSMSEGHVRHLINTMSENGTRDWFTVRRKRLWTFLRNVLEEFQCCRYYTLIPSYSVNPLLLMYLKLYNRPTEFQLVVIYHSPRLVVAKGVGECSTERLKPALSLVRSRSQV